MYCKDKNITKQLPAYRRMLNLVTPSRDQASVYFQQTINLTKTLPWLAAQSEKLGTKVSFLHLFIAAVGRVMHINPNLNRYAQGGRVYQRDGVFVSVSVKKALVNGSKIVLLKIPVAQDESVETIVQRFSELLAEGRSGKDIAQEKEMSFFLKIPTFILRPLIRLIIWLDYKHLLPGFFVDPDPLFASIVVANLGSIGLAPAYHHLYEYGNCPFFAAIGKIYDEIYLDNGVTKARKALDIKYTFDERIEDGLATALALAGLKEIVEDPEKLHLGIKDYRGRPPEET